MFRRRSSTRIGEPFFNHSSPRPRPGLGFSRPRGASRLVVGVLDIGRSPVPARASGSRCEPMWRTARAGRNDSRNSIPSGMVSKPALTSEHKPPSCIVYDDRPTANRSRDVVDRGYDVRPRHYDSALAAGDPAVARVRRVDLKMPGKNAVLQLVSRCTRSIRRPRAACSPATASNRDRDRRGPARRRTPSKEPRTPTTSSCCPRAPRPPPLVAVRHRTPTLQGAGSPGARGVGALKPRCWVDGRGNISVPRPGSACHRRSLQRKLQEVPTSPREGAEQGRTMPRDATRGSRHLE